MAGIHAALMATGMDGMEACHVIAGDISPEAANAALNGWLRGMELAIYRFDLGNAPWLTCLPDGMRIDGWLALDGCVNLRMLPMDLVVTKGLCAKDCVNLRSLPDVIDLETHLNIVGCRSLERLPDGMRVGGNAYLDRCDALKSLPKGMRVGGNLYLSGCVGLRELPEDIGDEDSGGIGAIVLDGCSGLMSLPERMVVRDGLDLTGCSGLVRLPERLAMDDGNLDLRGCVRWDGRIPAWDGVDMLVTDMTYDAGMGSAGNGWITLSEWRDRYPHGEPR